MSGIFIQNGQLASLYAQPSQVYNFKIVFDGAFQPNISQGLVARIIYDQNT